jgi:hypothetical protein
MILKSIPEAGYDTYTGENRPIEEKQTKIDQWHKRKDYAASGTIFRIVFKGASRNFPLFSSA